MELGYLLKLFMTKDNLRLSDDKSIDYIGNTHTPLLHLEWYSFSDLVSNRNLLLNEHGKTHAEIIKHKSNFRKSAINQSILIGN